MSTATSGTGTITLGSAQSGYQTFADAGITNAQIVSYAINDGAAWEVGTGTYTSAGTTLTRTVTESSNADAAISLSGSATVFITARKQDMLLPSEANSFTSTEKAQMRTNIEAEQLGVTAANRTETDSFTFVLTDAGKTVLGNKATAMNATVPPNSSVAFAVNTWLNLAQKGAGAVTIVAGSGVTLRSRLGLVLGGQYSGVSMLQVAADEWYVFGDVKAS